MISRRDFLKSTVLLPSALTISSYGQARLTSEAFADFENGTYDDWTLEGNCWTPEPATNETFGGKITGFQGKRFLCTLHPRLGTAATGKAVSKEFTIERPFISFKIGGGNYPGQACLNLVVDGKIVHTATGDESANFSDVSWNVSTLVGRKAHLEIIDATTSDKRGYIMVDQIRFHDLIDFNNLPYQQVVTQMANKWRFQYGLPGVWCAFIKDAWVQACVASGTRKIGENLPASVNDHLNIGSVSKVIAGSLIAFFVADGTIKYETTVGDVFSELAKQYGSSPLIRATLQQLLTHTAGLPHAIKGVRSENGRDYRYQLLIKTLRTNGLGVPGQQYIYSNVGPVIAVAMVERLTRRSFESILEGKEGKSIGLSSPEMLDFQDNSAGRPAPHYLLDGKARLTSLEELRRHAPGKFSPSGNCSISLTDLCSFAVFTLTNSANLPNAIYQNMIHRLPDSLPSSASTASWDVSHGRVQHVFHDGITERGEYCYMSVRPAEACSVIFLHKCIS